MVTNSVNPSGYQPGNGANSCMSCCQPGLLRQPPSNAVPNANPMNNPCLGANAIKGADLTQAAATNRLAQVTQQGDQQIAAAAKSSGGGGGGGIFGAIGGILGGLFAGGGMVGMARGGPILHNANRRQLPGDKANGFADGGAVCMQLPQDQDKNDALATGYLIGALHQGKLGGTPETLQKAAMIIKQMLMDKTANTQHKGFAAGGPSSPTSAMPGSPTPTNSQLAEQSLLQALGLTQQSGQSNQPPQSQAQQSAQSPTAPQTTPTPTENPQAQQASIGVSDQLVSGQPNPLRGYATGGPGIGPAAQLQQGGDGQKPPLQPGQAFQGDGAVKGPGGPTDDAIPAKLSNGEFVMSAPATAFFGVDKLTQMNEKGKQGFMQAKQQVDQNQNMPGDQAAMPQQPPGAAMPPGMPTQAPQMNPGAMQPPMAASGGLMSRPIRNEPKGGSNVMRTRGSGFAGL